MLKQKLKEFVYKFNIGTCNRKNLHAGAPNRKRQNCQKNQKDNIINHKIHTLD